MRIVLIAGGSGSGKTTLYKRLLKRQALQNRLVKVVSVTTRPARKDERDGRDYLFIGKEEFLKRKRWREFLESQNVFGFLYGTPKAKVLGLLRDGKNVLLCIDVKGARQVKKIYPQAVSIFIMPPSLAVLKSRLEQRKTETAEQIETRLKVAQSEMAEQKLYDHVVVNHEVEEAVKSIEEIVK